MNDYLRFYKELNDQQRLAADAIDGPLLVLAGPGTGKTQLLSVRAGSILSKRKIRPENILILTYTNSAAKAMKERLAKVIGADGYEVEVGTFHSFANSIIQDSGEAANYVGDKIQLNDVEQVRAVEYILDNTKGVDEIRPFRAPYTYLKEISQRISALKKDGIAPDDFENYLSDTKNHYRHMEDKYIKRLRALAIVYRRYEELKDGGNGEIFDERGRYDFDDMILFATEALKKETALKEEYQELYRYVMVDEYQDTNGAQLELLFTLLDYRNPNLLCVGDDDQSIYRFQGASVGNFKLLTKRFPGIKTIYLKGNYRASRELIEVSGKIISLIPFKERMGPKVLEAMRDYRGKEIIFREFTTEEEELLYIVDKVKESRDRIEADENLSEEDRAYPYNNIAVLVRKRTDILKVIDAFLRSGIPYATDGKEDISGEKRVRQMLDVLELAHIDPGDYERKDLALYKVLTADYFQIPHADILRFISFVNAKRPRGAADSSILKEFLGYFAAPKEGLKLQNYAKMNWAYEIIRQLLEDARAKPVHMILMDFIKGANVFGYILKEYADNNLLRIRELRGMVSFVNMVKVSDVAQPAIRLDDFMLEMKTKKEHGLPVQGNLVTMTQAGVRIYTAHGSKGLEFHSVIIPFCLHNKNWPARPRSDMIQLPADLFKTKKDVDKNALRELVLQDETRLFYVAMTRAKSSLVFTATPFENSVSSRYLNGLDIQKDAPEYVDEEKLLEKSMDVTDMTDPFIGTEEVLRDMVKGLSLNPTRINTYMFCKRKFLYNDILKLPGPKKKSLVFGNCVHKALEDTYREFMVTEKFPSFQFFKNAFTRALKFQGVDKAMEKDCLNKVDSIKGWFALAAKDPVMPLGLEKKLLVTVGDNIIFTGKYDKVEWVSEKDGVVRIIDYKTGRPDDHLKAIDKNCDLASDECDGYLRQLACYKLLFERDKKESGGMRAGYGELVFVEPVSADMRQKGYKKGDYASKAVEISDGMVAELDELIKNIWREINALNFAKLKARDEDKCGKCDFDAMCWCR